MSNEALSIEPRTYLPTYDGCFVCGQDHAKGLRIRYYVGRSGKVHTVFKPDQFQASYAPIVHGGVLTSILDELMGWPMGLQTGLLGFTGEIKVRFKARVLVGKTYTGTGYPGSVSENQKYWTGKAEICDEDGTVCAVGEGQYFLFNAEQTKSFADKMTYQPGDLQVFQQPLDTLPRP